MFKSDSSFLFHMSYMYFFLIRSLNQIISSVNSMHSIFTKESIIILYFKLVIFGSPYLLSKSLVAIYPSSSGILWLELQFLHKATITNACSLEILIVATSLSLSHKLSAQHIVTIRFSQAMPVPIETTSGIASINFLILSRIFPGLIELPSL